MAPSKLDTPLSEAPPDYNDHHDQASNILSSQLAGTHISELAVQSRIPNVSQTICHLKLLHAIAKLKEQITNTNGLFGLFDLPENEPSDDYEDLKHSRALLRLRIKEKRWAVYVQRAASRFTNWWTALRSWQNGGRMLTVSDLLAEKGKHFSNVSTDAPADQSWIKGKLPPLDILMVWHAFMLNPHDFLEDCLRQCMGPILQQGMPWEVIDSVIDTETGEYRVDEMNMKSFESFATEGSSCPTLWNNLDDDPEKVVSCPYCHFKVMKAPQMRVPWTTTGTAFAAAASELTRMKGESSRGNNRQEIDLATVNNAAESGQGFADPGFKARCQSCRRYVDHDYLRGAQFYTDALSWKTKLRTHDSHMHWELMTQSVPLKGTLLNEKGIPEGNYCQFGLDYSGRTFPNRLFGAIMSFQAPSSPWTSLDQVRDEISIALKDRTFLKWTMQTNSKRLMVPKGYRSAIRRMMSHYWNNSSPFSTDLAAAVIRQGSFIDKMQDIDWLHSPAIASTMGRLIQKYERFFKIMGQYPADMAVPTLDVDLAWHTHQLSPRSYYDYSKKMTNGKFIDHDDKVSELKLSNAFAKTSERYQKLFGSPYSECTCWYCEAIRAEHTSSISRAIHKSSTRSIEDQLHNASESGVHVSAHNVVRPQMDKMDESKYRGAMIRYHKKLNDAYEKACKRARKEGRPEPTKPKGLEDLKKDGKASSEAAYDARIYSLYYYPYPIGFYPAPYAVAPAYCPGMYACDPGCATTVNGAAGNCVAGTCGGGMAGAMCGAGGQMGAACSGGSGAGVGSCGAAAGGCGGGGGGCGGGGGGCGGGGGG